MTALEKRMLWAGFWLVSLSGGVYGWMRYLLDPVDEWAVINHPWQPHLQHLHVLAAPILVFAVGLIFQRHVWRQFVSKNPSRRLSGVMALAVLLPMIVSGYLLQTSTAEGWRKAWIVTHVVSSSLFVLAMAIHAWFGIRGAKGEAVLLEEIPS